MADTNQMRIFLSKAETSHAEEILNGISNGSGIKIAFFSGPFSLKAEQSYLHKMRQSESDELFLIRRYSDGGLLGIIGLHEIDFNMENARIGMMIFPAFQNMKLEETAISHLLQIAFDELKLNTVFVNVPECDGYMTNVFMKLQNFQCDGILRGRYKLANKFYNLSVFSVVNPER